MKPMLAVNIETEAVRFPVYASAKLDGIRGLVIDGRLLSRSLKPIPNAHVTARFSRSELTGFDGELIVGPPTAKDAFRVTSSALSRGDGAPNAVFYVFDNFDASGGFSMRLATLRNQPNVIVLEQRLIHTATELAAYEAEMLTAGYEGLILRDPAGVYKKGRSTAREQGMLKVKRFTDGEAVIIGVVEELENQNEKTINELGRSKRSSHQAGKVPKGRAGALIVRDVKSGAEFQIGTGLDAEERGWFWEKRRAVLGKVVKYKSFLIGVKDAPRFPVYLGGRESWDM